MLKRSLLAALTLMAPAAASATQIVIDYTYASDFFSQATDNGRAARATVEAVADRYSDLLGDTLSPIRTPEPFVGERASVTWAWHADFINPSGPGEIRLDDLTIAADEYRLYVGAQPLPGDSAGRGGSGGWGATTTPSSLLFSLEEFEAFEMIDLAFFDAVTTRGQAVGEYSGWGGSLSFDSDRAWSLDHTAPPLAGTADLYSVALHEIGHTLGFGSSAVWQTFVSPAYFLGEASKAANGGEAPPLDAIGLHWAEGTTSRVWGGSASQEAAYAPSLDLGERKQLTELDVAGLEDLGWAIVPEPAGLGVVLTAASVLFARRRR
ncbi:Matrixin [Planctomycetes bacterium MalM25]|nr:Matrixin [Planctomycetes bacterium MalM25]